MHSWPEEPEINDIMVPDLYVYNPQKYYRTVEERYYNERYNTACHSIQRNKILQEVMVNHES